MNTRRRIASLVMLSFALSSAPATAWADPPGGADSKVAAGEALAEQAFNLYKEGRFSESVAMYSRAYELTGSSAIVFNIANIYDRKLREIDLAVDYYRRYLRMPDANPELLRRANDRLEALKHQSTPLPTASPSASTTPAAPPPDRPDPVWRATGLVLGGLGVVSLGVSGAFALQAKSKNDESDKYCSGRECTDPRGPELADDAVSAANVSTITFGAGLAALVGGAVIFFAGPTISGAGSAASPAPRAAAGTSSLRAVPSLGPQLTGLSLTGAW